MTEAEVTAQMVRRRLPEEAGPWFVEVDGDRVIVHAGAPFELGPECDLYGLMGALDQLEADQDPDFLRHEILDALEQFS